jgi:hypothetical protein
VTWLYRLTPVEVTLAELYLGCPPLLDPQGVQVDFLWVNPDGTAHVVYPDGAEGDVPPDDLTFVQP